MNLSEILHDATLKGASDIFIIAGIPVTYKVKGTQDRTDSEIMKPDAIKEIVREIYETARRSTVMISRSRSVTSEGSG